MDFEKIAAEFADGLSAGPIPEPASEKVERYSSRVCSRLKELCLPLHLTGADRRKWSAAKKEGGAA